MVTKKELLRKMAELETINDQLSTEITYVDHLMRQVGFADGLATVKETAQDMMDEKNEVFRHLDQTWGDEGLETL